MKAHLTAIASLVFGLMPLVANAADKGNWRVGVLAGQVGLLGDVGDYGDPSGPNAVGYGLSGGYYLQEDLALEASYLFSDHEQVRHNNLSFSGVYYLGDYLTAYPHIDAGVSFINNEIKSVDTSGDGVAFHVGGGFDFEVTEFVTAGLQARYYKGFESSTRVNGQNVPTVGDSLSVMLSFIYRIDTEI